MSEHDYAIGILREKIQFYMDELKKNPFHKRNSIWEILIKKLESAIKRLKDSQ